MGIIPGCYQTRTTIESAYTSPRPRFRTQKSSNLAEVNKIGTFEQKSMNLAKYRRSGNEFSIKSPHFCHRARECPQTAHIASGGPLGIIPGCYQTRTTIEGAYTSPRPRFRTKISPYLVEVNKIGTFEQKPMIFIKYQRSGKDFPIKSPAICYQARECPQAAPISSRGPLGIIPGCYQTRTTIVGTYTSPRPRFRTLRTRWKSTK